MLSRISIIYLYSSYVPTRAGSSHDPGSVCPELIADPRVKSNLGRLARGSDQHRSDIRSARYRLKVRDSAPLCSIHGLTFRLGDHLGVRLGPQLVLTRRLSSGLGLGSRLGTPLGFVRDQFEHWFGLAQLGLRWGSAWFQAKSSPKPVWPRASFRDSGMSRLGQAWAG